MNEQVRTTNEGNETFNLRLEARLKNGDLVEAREKAGLSAKEAAEKIGICYQTYLNCEGMRIYPSLETQEKICNFYRSFHIPLFEEEVFPEELRHTKPSNKYLFSQDIPRQLLISLDRVPPRQLSYDPNEKFDSQFLKEAIKEALGTLTDREAEVINSYFGLDDNEELTLEEIGRKYSITRTRVNQIKQKAIRHLKFESRSKMLQDYVE